METEYSRFKFLVSKETVVLRRWERSREIYMYATCEENCVQVIFTGHLIFTSFLFCITYFIQHWSEMREFVANFVHQPGVYHDIMERLFFPITLYWRLDGAPSCYEN